MDVPDKELDMDVRATPETGESRRTAGGGLGRAGLIEGKPTGLPPMTPPLESDKPRPGPAREESWTDRCGRLFDEMRRPARAMVARAYGRSLSDEEIEDVYSAAWAATLSALRDRGPRMEEAELRAYILTAVASHASKEMRRRSRKPVHPLEPEREQVVSDGNSPLPDEIAIGSEARGVARDLLTSLPVRRRAVMLLRYGWGLSPREVCALVPGLSPRAYRKEVTRGVEDLIGGLKKVDSGEWCAEREDLIRDLIAGTADESERRQALSHLEHCRACSDLASRISRHLQEAGSLIAFAAVSGCIGSSGLTLAQRIGDAVAAVRSTAAAAAERTEATATSLVAPGGAKGSGAAGAGIVAKLAGAGGAAKTAMACVGAGAAATACVAAGVVPGVAMPDLNPKVLRGPTAVERSDGNRVEARPAIASVIDVSRAVRREESAAADPPPSEPTDTPGISAPSADPAPAEPEPTPAPVEEFDPVAATAPAAAPAPSGTSQDGGTGSGGSVAQDEFGP
jgi:RNA polymerase sigma factor (sigma-70 family)